MVSKRQKIVYVPIVLIYSLSMRREEVLPGRNYCHYYHYYYTTSPKLSLFLSSLRIPS